MSVKGTNTVACETVECTDLSKRKACLVKNAESSFRPFYVALMEGSAAQPKVYRLIIRTLALGFGPYAVWLILLAVSGEINALSRLWYVMFMPAIILAGLSLLHQAYYLVANPRSMQSLLDGICDEQGLDAFVGGLERMFTSPWQRLFVLVFASAGTANAVLFFRAYPAMAHGLPVYLVAWLWLYIFYAAFLVGAGVWLAATSLAWVYAYTSTKCIKVQGLHPRRHAGLKVLASVIGTYSLSFSLETSLTLSAFFSFDWDPHKGSALIHLVRKLWLCVFVPFIVTYFVYPQYRIGRIIRESKEMLLDDIESKMNALYFAGKEHDVDTVERILRYAELRDKLQAERSHVWDISAIYRFCSAIFLPAVVFVLQNPQPAKTFWDHIRGLFGR